MAIDYRQRLYESYVRTHLQKHLPTNLAAIQLRRPQLDHLIRHHFPSNRDATILDIGCGHGALVHFAHQAGYQNMSGVDTSPEQVAAAQNLGIEGVILGDIREMIQTLPSDSQDAIVAYDVIEHLTKDELLALADEVFRILKPGGRWILHIPNAESPFYGSIRHGDFTHEIAFTKESLVQVMTCIGFHGVESFEDRPVPHGLKSTVRLILWQMIHLGLKLYQTIESGNSQGALFTRCITTVAYK